MKIIYDKCDMCESNMLAVCSKRAGKLIVQCDRCGAMFEIYDNRKIHKVRKSLVKNKKKINRR